MMNSFAGNGLGRHTAAADTPFRALIPPDTRGFTRLTRLIYLLPESLEHTLTICRKIGDTTTSSAAATGQPVVNLTANPGPSGNALAAGDYIAIREVDDVTRLYKVLSVASLAFTLTTNLVAGADAGAKVWDFGISTDTCPATGRAHDQLVAFAWPTVDTAYWERVDNEGGLFASFEVDDPIMIESDNPTEQGYLEYVGWAYTVG